MKNFKNIKTKTKIKIIICLAVISVYATCGVDFLQYQNKVEPPSTAKAGERFTVKLECELRYTFFGTSGFKNLIVGVLVPKKWNGGTGDNITMAYASDLGNGVFVKMSPNEKVPNETMAGLSYPEYFKQVHGAGRNLFDDHEWVVYKSDKQYELNANQMVKPVITITIKTGPENMLTKLAYVVGLSEAGLAFGADDNKVLLSNTCFTVTNGTGELIDFCNPPLASVSPLAAGPKDFITFAFDNDLQETKLSNSSNIYLCATAYLRGNIKIERCSNEFFSKLQFKPLPNKKYKLSIYPKEVFGLTEGQVIDSITYHITNGTDKVGKRNTANPFLYEFTNCD